MAEMQSEAGTTEALRKVNGCRSAAPAVYGSGMRGAAASSTHMVERTKAFI